jgi:hypothetical protein
VWFERIENKSEEVKICQKKKLVSLNFDNECLLTLQ